MKEGEAIVRLLIQAGASINEKNKDGMTALMMASAKKVVDLLKQAGAE
jgi:ankyrin repeat protein